MDDYRFLHQKLIEVMHSIIDDVDWLSWRFLVDSNSDNPSSTLDKAVNTLLCERLQRIFDYPIVSEETYAAVGKIPASKYVWIVDPIDGTINLLAGVDGFGISVALVETENLTPVLSSVAVPHRNTVFSAVAGFGSYENGQPLSVMKGTKLLNILSYGIPGDAHLFSGSIIGKLKFLIESKWTLRQGGAAALDICYTAKKHWKAFWEPNLFLWDFVAAELIAAESGCIIYRRERQLDNLRYDLLIISSEEDAPQLVSILLE